MKARVLRTDKQIDKAVRERVAKDMTEAYGRLTADGAYQMLAAVMCVLKKNYGFGEKRLNDFKDLIIGEFKLMNEGIAGHKYTTKDCIKYIRDNFRIDFEEDYNIEYKDNEDTMK